MAGAATEIDDIFSGKSSAKGKAKQVERVKVAAGTSSENKKAKKTVESSKKRAAPPETIVDPSKAVEMSVKKAKKREVEGGTKKKRIALTEEEKDFRDTRGTARRKTEDGLTIYTEAELGLNSKGGDTPLCPIDCDCCF